MRCFIHQTLWYNKYCVELLVVPNMLAMLIATTNPFAYGVCLKIFCSKWKSQQNNVFLVDLIDIKDFFILPLLLQNLHKDSHKIREFFWDVKTEVRIFGKKNVETINELTQYYRHWNIVVSQHNLKTELCHRLLQCEKILFSVDKINLQLFGPLKWERAYKKWICRYGTCLLH